ncbi:MAG: insulinase family protein [Gammaproteobacteria bacterium]|nr:insulinase family protein [Gammaproteobacteria bacterium]MCW8959571.1 insulinase family protein [Gammaproteobacteria bacterium]MCW8972525.1 insulinase family protein [Gammaproteobacteria bacterium]MCW8993137.1 insulinase family protein [Gammaproteobacteria bacterium]
MPLAKRLFAPLLLALLSIGGNAALAVPDIQHWRTDNGARVYFVEAPELPMVDIRVVFDAGAARGGGLPGLAMLTNGMLEEGAGGLDADTIARRFASLGARFSASSHRDMATAGLRSLTKPELLQPAMETFALLLSQPDFPAAALERVRKQMLTGLQHEEQQPDEIASKAFYRTLYGDHPYASPPGGTRASIEAISRDDVEAYYRRYYVGANATVAIVGAVDRGQAMQLAEQAVGGLKTGHPAETLHPVASLQEAQREHIDHPSSQTHVLMGQPGVSRGDPDYFPLYLGNHILGGSGLVSRISEEVREKRGLSYSAYSYFSPMRAKGPFVLGLQTRNETAGKALQVLRDTLVDFRSEGPTGEELEAAKRNITGGFALKVDSNSDILGYIAMIGFYQLPLDYLERFNERVEAVTAAQIRDAFRRRVNPETMVTVTVGAPQ